MSQTFDPSRIAAVLGFTTEELMLNRGGGMSDRQRVMLRSRRRTRRVLGGLSSGKVREVVGAARTRARPMPANTADPSTLEYGGGHRYELTIGKTIFLVRNRAVLDAFVEGGSYRAYYASGGGRLYNVLLSAERIG
jgi:hypothetical protein